MRITRRFTAAALKVIGLKTKKKSDNSCYPISLMGLLYKLSCYIYASSFDFFRDLFSLKRSINEPNNQ